MIAGRSGREDTSSVADRREALLAWLTEQGALDQNLVARARSVGARTGQTVEQSLNQMGVISDRLLVTAYSEVTGCAIWSPQTDPVELAPDDVAVAAAFLQSHRLVPVRQVERRLLVAAGDPLDDHGLVGLAFATGLDLDILIAAPADVRAHGVRDMSGASEVVDLDERKLQRDVQAVTDTGAESASARLLSAVFEAAVARGASDIHFEPRRHDLRIRLRVDGHLVEHQLAAADLSVSVISRIKVLANLDLGERRLPQDGRATFVVGGRPVDVRVAILPSAFGEASVLRILDRANVSFAYRDLGFVEDQIRILDDMGGAGHGLFLVTGPTGSGKTTTLYALLDTLRDGGRKILSVEDPIEYHFPHVVQTQAAPQIGLTFASALRAFLRQDPDVILVGEIRDSETAEVAIQAALTGHLVLASLHANLALGVVPRLLDMGVEPYQLGAALQGALAQRLVRKLCRSCRTQRPPTGGEREFLRLCGVQADTVFGSVGCPACDGAGYRGRIAVAEGFVCDEAIAAAIAGGEPMSRLEALVRAQGRRALRLDGCAKALRGDTTLSEIMALGGK
jgi:type II secretory ATPase GspE/PulE/Tfp pilus assembly ATPase PilB-like protein